MFATLLSGRESPFYLLLFILAVGFGSWGLYLAFRDSPPPLETPSASASPSEAPVDTPDTSKAPVPASSLVWLVVFIPLGLVVIGIVGVMLWRRVQIKPIDLYPEELVPEIRDIYTSHVKYIELKERLRLDGKKPNKRQIAFYTKTGKANIKKIKESIKVLNMGWRETKMIEKAFHKDMKTREKEAIARTREIHARKPTAAPYDPMTADI